MAEEPEDEEEEEEEEERLPGCTLFIKNLNFDTTEETLKTVRGSPAWVGAGSCLLGLGSTQGLMGEAGCSPLSP